MRVRILLPALVVICMAASVSVSAVTITVPTDQPTIQAGIDAASPGDTVLVNLGIYYENVEVAKPIMLRGRSWKDWEHAIVDCGDSDCVRLTAPGAKIERLEVRNGFRGLMMTDSTSASTVHAEQCDIGAVIGGRVSFQFCTVSECNVGLQITGSDNNIAYNVFSQDGIAISMYCSCDMRRNIIRQNSLEPNGIGIEIGGFADSNLIVKNTIAWSSNIAIKLDAGAEGDSIYDNDFLYNEADAYDQGTNIWDAGYPAGGNYWHELDGVDSDDDGIYDDPLPIPGGTGVDHYPVAIRNNHRCGDANCSWFVDIDDVVYLLYYIFSGGGDIPCAGLCIGDVNGAGDPMVDIDDIVYLIEYIFRGGPAPVANCCD